MGTPVLYGSFEGKFIFSGNYLLQTPDRSNSASGTSAYGIQNLNTFDVGYYSLLTVEKEQKKDVKSLDKCCVATIEAKHRINVLLRDNFVKLSIIISNQTIAGGPCIVGHVHSGS